MIKGACDNPVDDRGHFALLCLTVQVECEGVLDLVQLCHMLLHIADLDAFDAVLGEV